MSSHYIILKFGYFKNLTQKVLTSINFDTSIQNAFYFVDIFFFNYITLMIILFHLRVVR